MNDITCPTCSTVWTCNCGDDPCLFAGSNCDDCELDRLDRQCEECPVT